MVQTYLKFIVSGLHVHNCRLNADQVEGPWVGWPERLLWDLSPNVWALFHKWTQGGRTTQIIAGWGSGPPVDFAPSTSQNTFLQTGQDNHQEHLQMVLQHWLNFTFSKPISGLKKPFRWEVKQTRTMSSCLQLNSLSSPPFPLLSF